MVHALLQQDVSPELRHNANADYYSSRGKLCCVKKRAVLGVSVGAVLQGAMHTGHYA